MCTRVAARVLVWVRVYGCVCVCAATCVWVCVCSRVSAFVGGRVWVRGCECVVVSACVVHLFLYFCVYVRVLVPV